MFGDTFSGSDTINSLMILLVVTPVFMIPLIVTLTTDAFWHAVSPFTGDPLRF
jgi:hypothetical protein